jgi:hypothetical protein
MYNALLSTTHYMWHCDTVALWHCGGCGTVALLLLWHCGSVWRLVAALWGGASRALSDALPAATEGDPRILSRARSVPLPLPLSNTATATLSLSNTATVTVRHCHCLCHTLPLPLSTTATATVKSDAL